MIVVKFLVRPLIENSARSFLRRYRSTPQTPKGGFRRKEKLVERSATIGVLRYKFTIGQLLAKSHEVVQFARRSRAKLKLPATLDS